MKLPQTFSALVVLLLIMISPVHAEMVTRVVDGDTVDVRMPTGEGLGFGVQPNKAEASQ